jgi:hypothetical protein
MNDCSFSSNQQLTWNEIVKFDFHLLPIIQYTDISRKVKLQTEFV